LAQKTCYFLEHSLGHDFISRLYQEP
jgi:hypothetical protein